MPTNRIIHQRLAQLEGLLEIEYSKLHKFRREMAMSLGEAKINLEERLQREILPTIRRYETEYVHLAAKILPVEDGVDTGFSDSLESKNSENFANFDDDQPILLTSLDATQAVALLLEAVETTLTSTITGNRAEEIRRRLKKMEETLKDPTKTATAKLKIAIPVLPTLVTYELEIDNENLLVNTWKTVKELFKKGLPQLLGSADKDNLSYRTSSNSDNTADTLNDNNTSANCVEQLKRLSRGELLVLLESRLELADVEKAWFALTGKSLDALGNQKLSSYLIEIYMYAQRRNSLDTLFNEICRIMNNANPQ
jgi:hypothetical protein